MSDEALRELERGHAEGRVPVERLEAERLRRGLGWNGEVMPQGVTPKHDERGVYWFRPRPVTTNHFHSAFQLVYVSGGEECDRCDRGIIELDPEGPWTTDFRELPCPACHGSGKRSPDPFYIGRFPATLSEWMRYTGIWDYGRHDRLAHLGKSGSDANAHHPVTDIALTDAQGFCSWAGLRLPEEIEWRWAALGAPLMGRTYRGYPSDHGKETGPRSKRFPWGDEPPSEDRCVWSAHPVYGTGSGVLVRPDGTIGPMRDNEWTTIGMALHDVPGPAPVLIPKLTGKSVTIEGQAARLLELAPARPLGASWCGAHDMCGNVFEMVSSGLAFGGSFRSSDLFGWPRNTGPIRSDWETNPLASRGRDDVGFRVALSAS